MQRVERFTKTQVWHIFTYQLRHLPCLRKVARLLDRLAGRLLGKPCLVQRESSRVRDAEWHRFIPIIFAGGVKSTCFGKVIRS